MENFDIDREFVKLGLLPAAILQEDAGVDRIESATSSLWNFHPEGISSEIMAEVSKAFENIEPALPDLQGIKIVPETLDRKETRRKLGRPRKSESFHRI